LQPDGVILTPPHSGNPLIINLLAAHGISFARIGSLTEGPGIQLIMDDARAARIATEHPLELGHKRIGFIAGPPDYELSGWRVAGWQGAMAAAGLPTADLLAAGDFSFASGRRAATALLDGASPPTAIVASNDQMALATLELLRERQREVPADVSIVSFDDTPIVRFAHPALTAVVQPIAEVTARAVELIIAEQAGRAPPDAPTVVPVGLTVRGSTARAKAPDVTA